MIPAARRRQWLDAARYIRASRQLPLTDSAQNDLAEAEGLLAELYIIAGACPELANGQDRQALLRRLGSLVGWDTAELGRQANAHQDLMAALRTARDSLDGSGGASHQQALEAVQIALVVGAKPGN